MTSSDLEIALYILTGSRKMLNQITVVVLVLVLVTPMMFLSTTSNKAEDLVEIRSLIMNVEESPQTKTQVFTLDFYALSQVNAKFAVPLFEKIITVIYSNQFQEINVSYEIISIAERATRSNLIALEGRGLALQYSMKSNGFQEIYLFTLVLTIVFVSDYFFQGYESYIFLGDNFLMLPKFSSLFAREIGISYTGMVYSGPNYGGNPSKPLISQEENKSDSSSYSNFIIYVSGILSKNCKCRG